MLANVAADLPPWPSKTPKAEKGVATARTAPAAQHRGLRGQPRHANGTHDRV